MSHTPGPWKAVPSPHGRGYKCVQIGKDESYTTLEMLPADADLAAAAPDLLAAAQAAWNCIAELSPTQARVEVAQMLQAAIKKAA